MRSVPAHAAIAAVLLLALAACTPTPAPTSTAGQPSPTPSAPAPPTGSATPTPPADNLPDGVLFRITAVATAPDGSVANLTETVYTPVATVDPDVASQLDAQCDPFWRNSFASLAYLSADIDVETAGGAWAGADQLAVDLAGYPVWTGDTSEFMASCASAIIAVPGAAHGVSPVNGGGAETDGGWVVYRYGFGVVADPSLETPGPDNVVISDCAVELSSEAQESDLAASWPDDPELYNGLGCYFGGL